MPRKVPATIITGFLGAGKTTLVRHLLEHAQGRRLALIVNEFGDVGVDGDLLASCGVAGCRDEDIIELANGCLCCTVADEFLPAMQALLDRDNPPEHIIIETSGLALPKPLVQAFHWPDIRSRVTVDGVVTVVDAMAFAEGRFADDPEAIRQQADHDNPLDEVFTDQLAAADLVILNKTDLVGAAALPGVEAQLQARLRPGVQVVATSRGVADPLVLLGLSAAAEDDLAARPSVHDAEEEHDHDDFHSFAVALPVITDAGAWEHRVAAIIREHDILRLKGFLAIEGKATRHVVQAVGPRIERYFDRPWRTDETPSSTVVVIGKVGIDQVAIRAALAGG